MFTKKRGFASEKKVASLGSSVSELNFVAKLILMGETRHIRGPRGEGQTSTDYGTRPGKRAILFIITERHYTQIYFSTIYKTFFHHL